MDWLALVKSLAALAFVLALVLLAAHGLRKYGNGYGVKRTPKNGTKRLEVVESTMIDGRRRLVLVRRDEVEHLVMLSPEKDVVIETGIMHSAVAKKTWKVAE